uniref:Thiostrepton n=2 Tax=Streptomyces azureus TaxID=146537 RepID=THCL_STRAJ|nr:RecName: Full=Thiostrepton; AltName: Full=Alaninamide; AltName: Full=Bryamycin; AltName: Full=Gargon; AltName: Full=Thiactin; Flags: Precursor [Streptomyces azureus]ACR15111.1 thiostrepton prepropeptide [Streptomyces azureus]
MDATAIHERWSVMSNASIGQEIGVEGLTGLDVDALEISDYVDETLLDGEDLTVTMIASASCTTCICTCSCSS